MHFLLIVIRRHDIFDDQARKQFTKRSPNYNPFGSGETPLKFKDFDIFTKVSYVEITRTVSDPKLIYTAWVDQGHATTDSMGHDPS
jgi:hypothetical protein